MIINDSINVNEARTVDLGSGAVAYSYNGKYYIKKGDERKEISTDQYQKLLNKDKGGSSGSSSSSGSGKTYSENDMEKVMKKYDGVVPLGRSRLSPTLAPGNESGEYYYTDKNHPEDHPLVISKDNAVKIFNAYKNKQDYSDLVSKSEEEYYNKFLNHPNADQREYYAQNTDDPKLLAKFANDKDEYVRNIVAGRTDDSEILRKLANDKDDYVRSGVLDNPHIDDYPDILSKLSNDESFMVRQAFKVRKNPHWI